MIEKHIEGPEVKEFDNDVVSARYRRFKKARLMLTILALAAAPAVNLFIGELVPQQSVDIWNYVYLPTMALTLIAAYSSYTNNRLTKHGLPKFFWISATLLTGIIGSVPLLDTTSLSEQFVGASIATALGTLAAIPLMFGIIRSVSASMTIAHVVPIFATAFFYDEIQTNLLAVAALGLLFGLYVPFMQTKSFEELLGLRHYALAEAEEANHRSHHDHLTGLLNRLGITESFNDLDREHVTGLFFLDLDRFKDVNDRLGHELGDRVLIEVGSRLRQILWGVGEVARLGGDEFLIVITEPLEQQDLARQIIIALEEPFVLNSEEIHISASVGIATVEDIQDAELADLMRRSDYALYQAKSTGRGQAIEFSDQLADDRMEAATMREQLRRASRGDELEMWGQPIYDLSTGQIQSVELLARWRKENGEMVAPDQFIPLAEEMGTIDPITNLAIEKFVEYEEAWRDHPILSVAKLAINVSPRSFERGMITAQIAQACMDHGADPGKLVVEITEGLVFERIKESMSELVELRNMGITIALDDFGTGFSSMKRFFEMPISEVKIDKSLVDGVTQSAQKQMMTRAIVSMANSLNRICIAEGIETKEQLDAAASLGVSHGQGFLLCKPTPLDELADRAGGYFARHAPRIVAGPHVPKQEEVVQSSDKLVKSFITDQ